MLYGSLEGRGTWGRMDTCVAESLHCPPDTITTLLISYTPIQNKNLKKKKTILKKSTINAGEGESYSVLSDPLRPHGLEGVGKREASYSDGWNVTYSRYGKTVWRFRKKLKTELPRDPAIPLLGISGKNCDSKGTRTPVFTTALFTIAR